MGAITNNKGSLRGYTFTLSILVLSATLIALALYASEWRRSQQAAPANLALPSEALAIGNRVSSDVSNIIGGSAEISRNSTSASIKIFANLPFKKEGFPVADVSEYARSIPTLLGGEIPYEIALTANNLDQNNSAVMILPDSGAVLFENNGTNDTDVITYRHPSGWNLTGIAASIYCGKSKQAIANISSSAGAGATNYRITYSDLGGTYISNNTTQLVNNVTYSVRFADGTSLSFVTNISASGPNTTKFYYTKNPGAVLFMPFDANVSSNATGAVIDYSPYQNNGTLGGGNSSRLPAWNATGKSGGAYSFDGNWPYIDVPFSQSINITQNVSLTAWFYMIAPSNAGHGSGIISKGNGKNNGQYELIIGTNGYPYFRGTAQNAMFQYNCNTNVNTALNTWHFVAVTFNGSQINCFIDGHADGTFENTSWVMPLNSTNDSVAIGVRTVGGQRDGAPTSHFNGTIDEVRVYNRVLSMAEISNIFNSRYQDPCAINLTFTYDAAGLAGRELRALYNADLKVRTRLPEAQLIMPFDMNVSSNQTGAVLDYSAKGTSGTLGAGNSNNAPTWTSDGKSGGAYAFDGANDYINVSSSATPDVTSAVTVSLWEKSVQPASGNPSFAEKYGGLLTNTGWDLYAINGTATMGGRDGNSYRYSGYSTTNVSDGNWHHLVGTINNNIWSIYVDGELENSTDTGYTSTNLVTNAPLLIGQWNGGTSYVNGTIDELRIYSRALSADEVYALYRDSALVQSGQLSASSD